MAATLFYFHDPMCSWCWGYQTTWRQLLENLPDKVNLTYILGGLAADDDTPMPEDMQQAIQGHWRRIKNELGAEFNFDFWQKCRPRRSTYPACRAVIAASKQTVGHKTGQELSLDMILAIQTAYYVRAMNPSNIDTLCTLAEEMGLDREIFRRDLQSDQTENNLQEQIAYSRSVGVSSFPSLLLDYQYKQYRLTVDYRKADTTLEQIKDILLQA